MGACCSKTLVKTSKEDKHFPQFVSALPSTNKVIVITGTTTGTGFIAAKVCLEKGATVVTLNRKSERSDKAEAELKAISSGNFVPIVCDLNDFTSVKSAAEKIKELFPNGINVLANNAGIMAFRDVKTTHGYDIQMHTNHLAHFLLTSELFPLLEKAAASTGDARIINHSSEARKGKKLDAKYLQKNAGSLGGDSFFARFERYHHTKLANILFTYASKMVTSRRVTLRGMVGAALGVYMRVLLPLSHALSSPRASLALAISSGVTDGMMRVRIRDSISLYELPPSSSW